MIPNPLHPAIVHFPLVLAVLAPIFAAAVYFGIHTERLPRRSWIGILALQIALLTVTWVATQTGEREEETVERVVAERHINAHEENAERFLLLTAFVVPLAAAGLMSGPLGGVNRALTIALSVAALAAGVSTGHSGGQLVNRHGAAAAYAQQSQSDGDGYAVAYTGQAPAPDAADEEDDDDD